MSDKVYRILVVDDEPDIVEMTARRLKDSGYAAITALDGEQACAKLREGLADILVVDLNMPRKSGLEVLKELRTVISPGRWIPVIIVSGNSDLEDMRGGFELEADHYLTKPCKFEELLAAIQLMIQLMPLRGPVER
jgi:DNA-binding response OmpR family regulator